MDFEGYITLDDARQAIVDALMTRCAPAAASVPLPRCAPAADSVPHPHFYLSFHPKFYFLLLALLAPDPEAVPIPSFVVAVRGVRVTLRRKFELRRIVCN